MRFVRVTIGKCFETNQMHDLVIKVVILKSQLPSTPTI